MGRVSCFLEQGGLTSRVCRAGNLRTVEENEVLSFVSSFITFLCRHASEGKAKIHHPPHPSSLPPPPPPPIASVFLPFLHILVVRSSVLSFIFLLHSLLFLSCFLCYLLLSLSAIFHLICLFTLSFFSLHLGFSSIFRLDAVHQFISILSYFVSLLLTVSATSDHI